MTILQAYWLLAPFPDLTIHSVGKAIILNPYTQENTIPPYQHKIHPLIKLNKHFTEQPGAKQMYCFKYSIGY